MIKLVRYLLIDGLNISTQLGNMLSEVLVFIVLLVIEILDQLDHFL